jgi:hypothetical protein
VTHASKRRSAALQLKLARSLSAAAVLAVRGAVATTQAWAQESRGSANDLIIRTVALTAADSARLTRGETVVRVLRTGYDRDVAIVGAVQVAAPRSFFMDRQRDFARALRTPTRTQVQRFSDPAVIGDVQALAVSADDLKELRACRPNDCNFKLPAADMAQFGATIDMAGPDARERVAAAARQRIVEYVNDYRERGNAAMIVYDDRGTVHSSDAFVAMLRDSSLVFSAAPSLAEYLLGYPEKAPPGVTDVIFWSRDEMPHLRPVLRITHESIVSPSDAAGSTIIAAKQIYADHYFEAGLEVLAASDRAVSGSGSPGIFLTAVRRYRFDHLPSGGLLNVRSRVINALRDNVAADLTRLKRESEAAWASASAERR